MGKTGKGSIRIGWFTKGNTIIAGNSDIEEKKRFAEETIRKMSQKTSME